MELNCFLHSRLGRDLEQLNFDTNGFPKVRLHPRLGLRPRSGSYLALLTKATEMAARVTLRRRHAYHTKSNKIRKSVNTCLFLHLICPTLWFPGSRPQEVVLLLST